MTPVETLREAAGLMRRRAQAAIEGPWEAIHDEDTGDVSVRPVDDDPDFYIEVASTTQWPDHLDRSPTGDHIASWHPAVALAVADWLEATASGLSPERMSLSENGPYAQGALAVARAYLGKS